VSKRVAARRSWRSASRLLSGCSCSSWCLGAYWNRIEPEAGRFDTSELDWQVDAAERAGKQVIICLGPVKTFGYPEYFVPDHRLAEPLPEGSLIEPATHPALLAAGIAHARHLVERYKGRPAVVAWQVEHEAVDPLDVEHSWRLSAAFVAEEVAAVRHPPRDSW
jgi:beta-galactosidase GanA